MADRLHPESINTLRQLVKLHGGEALIEAITTIVRGGYGYWCPPTPEKK